MENSQKKTKRWKSSKGSKTSKNPKSVTERKDTKNTKCHTQSQKPKSRYSLMSGVSPVRCSYGVRPWSVNVECDDLICMSEIHSRP